MCHARLRNGYFLSRLDFFFFNMLPPTSEAKHRAGNHKEKGKQDEKGRKELLKSHQFSTLEVMRGKCGAMLFCGPKWVGKWASSSLCHMAVPYPHAHQICWQAPKKHEGTFPQTMLRSWEVSAPGRCKSWKFIQTKKAHRQNYEKEICCGLLKGDMLFVAHGVSEPHIPGAGGQNICVLALFLCISHFPYSCHFLRSKISISIRLNVFDLFYFVVVVVVCLGRKQHN